MQKDIFVKSDHIRQWWCSYFLLKSKNDILQVDYVSVKRMKTDGESSASRYVPKVEEVYSICNARIPYLILCNEVSANLNSVTTDICDVTLSVHPHRAS
jgi:hypothetical protein